VATLLVVDDDYDVTEGLSEILSLEGHEVRVAHDGARGWRQLEEGLADLILLDVDLPVLDGPGLARRMYCYDRGLETIPLVLVSGVPDLPQVAVGVGTPYYLSKPYTLEALLKMVTSALAERIAPHPPSSQGA
jgi:DNA-binding response OmpR family regulator